MSLLNPTVEEKRWMDAIVQTGCVACRVSGNPGTPAEVHHIVKGTRRLGHLFTIPLCANHHRSGRFDDQCVSRHPWRKKFEETYGKEMDLLEIVGKLVKENA